MKGNCCKWLLIVSWFFVDHPVISQSILQERIAPISTNTSLINYFYQVEEKYPVKFYYRDEWLEPIQIFNDYKNLTLKEILEKAFEGTDLTYAMMDDYSIVIIKDPTQILRKNEALSQAINSGKTITPIKIGNENEAILGRNLIVNGTVSDEDGKPLSGVSVTAIDIGVGTSSNNDGSFQFKMPSGTHAIRISYVNYEDKFIDLDLFNDGEFHVTLSESPTVLEEIVVVDKLNREITTSAIGQTQIIMKDVKRAPALLGEVDIIKQIQTLAGVTTVGEAASGYNVRGGSVDQNLILYDGLPVFNSSHVFGFFSTFNSEAIKDVSFIRGGIPAEYGGRASSVLDIRSKEGDYEEWKVSAGIGFVSSNLLIEGPIKKSKTSIVASIRSTYSDWLINSIKSNYVDLRNSTVKFFDDAIKVSHKFGPNSKLTYSWYNSNDQFRLSDDSTYRWNTKLNSLKLDQNLSVNLSTSLSLGFGDYTYRVSDSDEFNGFNLFYKLSYPSIKADFLYTAPNYKLIFGAQSIYYLFNPGTFEPSSPASIRTYLQIEKQRSLESGVYLSSQFYLYNKLYIDLGARYSFFQSFGPGSLNVYSEGSPRETSNLLDTLNYNSGDLISAYSGLEPRLGLRYEFSPKSSIKLGYHRIYQYLHLVTNTTAVTPIDIWQPSGYYFKPQMADQISLGYFFNFKEKTYDAYFEGYYKKINNVLDFKDGAQLILNSHLETDLLQGKSRAFGVESQISKLTGKLTGTLSYSFARSLRTITSIYSEETINGGKEYASNFDQPHIINLSWKYGFTRRHFFTGGFTYHTGRPITLPLNAYAIENTIVTSFSDRNEFRIPDYHRLDFGFVMEGNHKRKKIFDGTWTLSIYNVYGRKNPYTIFFKEVRPGILRPYRLSVIGTVLPSISYSLKI